MRIIFYPHRRTFPYWSSRCAMYDLKLMLHTVLVWHHVIYRGFDSNNIRGELFSSCTSYFYYISCYLVACDACHFWNMNTCFCPRLLFLICSLLCYTVPSMTIFFYQFTLGKKTGFVVVHSVIWRSKANKTSDQLPTLKFTSSLTITQ
jgi:hypothetical protein